MFAIKIANSRGARLMICVLLLLVLAGCTPPGPKALLDGERLIEEGEFQKAVTRLEVATELMPANAQAWNFLGLALHGAGRRQEAAQAYQRAVGLDQDLAVARYNMGCLQLEAGNAAQAEAEFTAFTLNREESVDGWLKLASAQLRGGRFGSSEQSYGRALALDSDSAEAWNGLGLSRLGRNRVQEAGPCFDKALSCDPSYAAALLNRAIFQQQHARNTTAALQNYRAYLALEPRAPDWSRVQQLASHLELQVAQPVRTETTANRDSEAAPVAKAKPEPREAVASRQAPAREVVPPQRSAAVTPETVRETKPEPVTPKPVPRQTEPVRTAESSFEVVQLDRPNAIQPARDAGVAQDAGAVPRNTPAGTTANPVEVTPPPPAREKPGFFARLNPANLFRRDPDPPTRSTPLPTGSRGGAAATTSSERVDSSNAAGSPGVSRRYPYLENIELRPGDRSLAQGLFARGANAHRVSDLDDAVSLYESALRADPAYFDVHYNLGLVQYQRGDWMASARAYERALALNSSNTQARYNFALALKQGSFFADAARELEKVLVINPREVPARFALANLYANELRSPKLARVHYEKVLEDSPSHPKSIEIRYWLRANP